MHHSGQAMKALLFVCSGNAGRSPAAQYLGQEYIDRDNLPIEVQSRGTNVRDHSRPDLQLLTALPAARSHVPTALDEEAIEWADLILTMNRQHKQIVIAMIPGAVNKTYCLYEYADGTTKAVVSAQLGDELLHVRHTEAGDQVVAGARMVGAVAAGHDVTETVRAEQRIEQRVEKRQ